jgi:WhiB family redox-sensing transcriptional regulator
MRFEFQASGVHVGGAPRSHHIIPDVPAWHAEALCAETDPDVFFPEIGGSPRQAKSVCAQCPVRLPCLQWALDQPDPVYGVWGGTTERERRAMTHQPSPPPPRPRTLPGDILGNCQSCGIAMISDYHWRSISHDQRRAWRLHGVNGHRARGICEACYTRRRRARRSVS